MSVRAPAPGRLLRCSRPDNRHTTGRRMHSQGSDRRTSCLGDLHEALPDAFHSENAKPAPSRDATGRCHDPELTDLEDLSNEELGEGIREIEQSIEQRQEEILEHADLGDVQEMPGHSERVRREANWLKRAVREWENRGLSNPST